MTEAALEGFRLSLQQRRVWQLQQASPAYRIQCAVRLAGQLNISALQQAIAHVVQRHEILRTTFQRIEGLAFPLQVIAERGMPSWQELDLRDLNAQAQEGKIEALFQHERLIPCDDAHGSLLRCALLRLAAEQHQLLITLPALCADAWTLQHLVQEISALYAADPHTTALPEVPMQYADFAAWQDEVLTDENGAAGRAYWRAQVSAAGAVLSLPGMTIPADNASDIPQSVTVTMTAEEMARLTAMARQYDTSVAVCLLACWQLLLWRLTDQSDIIVGYVGDGRKYAELQGALGLFARTLPIRGHFAENVQCGDLVRQLHVAVRDAVAWLEYHPGYDSPDTGLAVGFSYVERLARHDCGALSFAVQRQYSCTERFHLHLACEQAANALLVELHYDPGYFRAEDMTRLAGRFTTLCANLSAAPQTPVGAVEILSATERLLLLETWNNSLSESAPAQCVAQLFEAQVSQTPDALAVVCADAALTYRMLNERANQVAYCLRAMGVGAEVLVGLYMERGLDLVVGILGILKAGGAYVPFDPAYPQQRLAFMLADARVQVLLTQAGLATSLPAHCAQVCCLDTAGPLLAQQSTVNPPRQSVPQNLAYVMYTSGSTGEPRGAMITQANVCHYVQALQGALRLCADDRYLQTASVAFSSSVRQLLLPLTHGATLVMATAEHLRDPLALCQVIRHQQVTVLDIMPSYWRHLMSALERLPVASRAALLDNGLRLITSASEPLVSDIPRTWSTACRQQARLLNMFGQTETTGIVTVYPIPEQDSPEPLVPIGRPLENTQCYLLDAAHRPVPIGLPGELCVSGRGLGRGYLHHPDLTAQKFVPQPFAAEPGARLYTTGDLARYRSDGTVVFLGRIDHQVKIRGMRIEPGEIEAALLQLPAVAAAVVVTRQEAPGDTRLVAYIVPRLDRTATLGELRRFLQAKLPDFMVPNAFVILSELPLTPNGKVDRQALPVPGPARADLGKTLVAPRTPIEEMIAGVWADVLGRERIGIHDNFFELGGHSLLAAQVIYRVNEALLVAVPLRSLFEAPTVAELAGVVSHLQSEAAEQAIVAKTLADIQRLSADEVHTQLTVEHEESGGHAGSC